MVLSVVVGLLSVESAVFQGTTALAISYTGITLALGFYLAGWNSFLGEATSSDGRGSYLAAFARLAAWGSLAALLLTTAVTFAIPSYTILFLVSGVAFVLSSVFLRGQREAPVQREQMSSYGSAMMTRYYLVTSIYGLFWGFAGPSSRSLLSR